MSQTIQRCPKCGFPFVYCQCKTPIREAAEAVSDYVTDALDVATGFEDEIEAIIQRVLRERALAEIVTLRR